MLLQYGPISLNLLQLEAYKQEAIYDGPSYVCTKFTLGVRAVYNPATQGDAWGQSPRYQADNSLPVPYVPNIGSWQNFQGTPNFSPPGGPLQNTGIPAPITNTALRHLLLQPRQQLVFSVGGVLSIVSPLPPAPSDVMNGPFPLYCEVEEMMGTRTWMVSYAIETFVNECPLYGSPFPLVLSHTWTARHELDEDYFTKQTFEGRIVLRADSLGLMGLPADFFRSQLLPLPAPGFKREAVQVTYPKEEPNCLHYTITDRQLPIGWTEAGVTRVEAFHTVRSVSQTPESQAAHGVGGALGLLGLGDLTGLSGTTKAIGAASGAIGGIISALPQTQHIFQVEVWGDGTSTRSQLEGFALGIIQTRLSGLFQVVIKNGLLLAALSRIPTGLSACVQAAVTSLVNGLGLDTASLQCLATLLYGWDRAVTHELTGKHVSLQWTMTAGPLMSLVTPFATARINTGNGSLFPDEDDTLPYLIVNGNEVNNFNNNASIFQWPPPGDGSSRGDWIGFCLGAALQSPCSMPFTPYWTINDADKINASDPVPDPPPSTGPEPFPPILQGVQQPGPPVQSPPPTPLPPLEGGITY